MSQGEALLMDPQQRLLLQGAWEALGINANQVISSGRLCWYFQHGLQQGHVPFPHWM